MARTAEARAGASRATPSSTPSSSSASPDQASSTSASTPRRRRILAVGLIGEDQVGRLVEDGRLADAGLSDDRQRTTLADGGARGEAGDGVDDVLTAVQRRAGALAGGSGSVISQQTARGLPDAGETVRAAD